MTFGEAISLLKQGYPVYRDSWKPGLYVIKQIDSDIDSTVVPKMQSLPSQAKELVLSNNDGSIHYRNQCIIIDTSSGNTVATNYIPDWHDMFSSDWNIHIQK